MSRKVYITISVPIIVQIDEGVEVCEVMDNTEIEVHVSPNGPATLEDTGPFKWEVTDSK